MFQSTYKTTIRNLFRAPIFWLMSGFLLFTVFYNISRSNFGVFYYTLGELISASDPRYVADYEVYIKVAANSALYFMATSYMPLFTVVSTVLILNRDYGDNFYEIEKAAGIKPSVYFFGRLAALITVNFAFIFILAMLNFHLYFLVHGSVEYLDIGEYLIDSFPRVMRNIIFVGWPCILMYICVTYFGGCIFSNGTLAAILSFSLVMINKLLSSFSMRFSEGFFKFYRDYLSHTPYKVSMYFYWFDTPGHESFIKSTEIDTSIKKVLICIAIFLVSSLAYVTVSYIRTRKRDK